ncbi:hypothetical protein MTR67_013198 [Solanum verrucosum]|uniref:Uncharacterized protein n=1 Tax=Solanum verrucosum TaxID=315347 RepID=A0AAF0QB33_SOLVR|nr:hypothetical protein MTR67_013198 [Solanum verrucosum]
MKRDIIEYVSRCLNCLQVKYEHQRPGGMSQRMHIPEWKWERIAMDFVVGLPRTLRKFDDIWVIMDRWTKSAHFVPVQTSYNAERLARTYIQEIVRVEFRTTFHPQTDGQSERTIQVLEDMLRACVIYFGVEVRPWGTDLLRDSLDKVKLIQDRLLTVQSRQKSYTDKKVRDLEFMIREKVLLKGSPMKGVMRFGKKGQAQS